MELVSVIVPVYNTEKYLRECIESILSSTYSELEIILIDDGSTDSSGQICDEYASRDLRIRVIHQNNEGIVGARNAGLAIATGTFLAFVDADDVISPILYECMVRAMQNYSADIVTCEYQCEIEKLDKERIDSHFCFESLEDQISVIITAPWMRNVSWTSVSVWNKLYRSSCLTQRFQPEYPVGEDLKFNWDFIQNSRKMVVLPTSLYFYRQREGSVMGIYRMQTGKTEAAIRHALLVGEIADTFSDSLIKQYLDAKAAYMAHSALWRIYLANKNADCQVFIRLARNRIRNAMSLVWKDKCTYPTHIRMMMGLCCYCFAVWRASIDIYRMYLKRRK